MKKDFYNLCRCGRVGGYAEDRVLGSGKQDHLKNTKLGLFHNGFFIFGILFKFKFFVTSKLYYNIMLKFYLHNCGGIFVFKERIKEKLKKFIKINKMNLKNLLIGKRLFFVLKLYFFEGRIYGYLC